MEQRYNIVRVKELTKGVESIVEVDWKNPEWVEGFFKIKKFFIGIETCNPPTFSKASSVFVLCITVALFFFVDCVPSAFPRTQMLNRLHCRMERKEKFRIILQRSQLYTLCLLGWSLSFWMQTRGLYIFLTLPLHTSSCSHGSDSRGT